MPKEILLYSSIYSYSVADFINAMEEAKDEDVRVRVNSPGGEVYYGFGAIAKFNEHRKGKSIQVDGRADSFAAIICCCAENVECLDVSTFLFHRAAFPEWIENSSDRFTDAMKASLEQMNKQLRGFMEGKMKADEFEKVAGVSYDDLFSLNSRIDVVLDAKQAKKLGLVSKVVAITPQKKAEIERDVMAIAAASIPAVPPTPAAENPTQQPPPKSSNTMTLEQLKREYPEVYASAKDEGVKAERDRVSALMVYADVDLPTMTAKVKDGSALSAAEQADLLRKSFSKQALGKIAADSAKDVETEDEATEVTAEKKATDDFQTDVRKRLGLKLTEG